MIVTIPKKLLPLFLLFFLIIVGCSEKELPFSDLIRLNQVGFYPSENKTAVVASEDAAYKKFMIRNIQSGEIVYKGNLSAPRSSSFSNKKTAALSFHEVNIPGTYQIEIPSIGKSFPFEIKENLLAELATTVRRTFQYQQQIMPDEEKLITVSAFTVGMLLSLFEDFNEYILATDASDPNYSMPELLSDAYDILVWMLTKQDSKDGGVYEMNAEKSVNATLLFAASMAQASRLYPMFKTEDPNISTKISIAAEKAFKWAMRNSIDKNAFDGIFWAATELYFSTGDEKYFEIAQQYAPEKYTTPTWNNVYALGTHTLIRYGDALDIEERSFINRIKNQLLIYAETSSRHAELSPYAAPYGRDARDFFWGCNADRASSQGIAFIYAWMITNNAKYSSAALQNMDYLLGRNATEYCFVTGFGSKNPQHPYGFLSSTDTEIIISGFLVGGPNPQKEDQCIYPSEIPDECYIDNETCYASNGLSLNWQSLFAYFSTALEVTISKK